MQCNEINIEEAQGLRFDTGCDSLLVWQRRSKSYEVCVSRFNQVNYDDIIQESAAYHKSL